MRDSVIRVTSRYFCRNVFKMSRSYGTMFLKNYDCYGFDIDHTLAKYNLPTLFKVSSENEVTMKPNQSANFNDVTRGPRELADCQILGDLRIVGVIRR